MSKLARSIATVDPAPRLAVIGSLLQRFDDGVVTRWVFRALLAGTCTVLAMDFYDLSKDNVVPAPIETSSPLLPPVFETDKPLPADPRKFMTGDQEALRAPIRFTLQGNGVLTAEGTVDAGAANRLAAELDQRGEYVRTVSLNSPGGALQEAIEMAKMVRERKLDTKVADGALCASSCPLIFAGGRQRLAGVQSAIGVHQFFATTVAGTDAPKDPAQAMSNAQTTAASISRHLAEMGVDPSLWLHAMETPPQALYYLSSEELRRYKLATGVAKASE